MKTPAVATALLLALAHTFTSAQTVYRCGPDGRIYADRPCTEGRAVDVADARDASQRREAQSTAAAQRRLAQDLATQRAERERVAAAMGNGPAGIARPTPVEFTPPSSAAQVPRQAGKKRKTAKPAAPARGTQAHTTWQATSPAQPR